MSVRHALRRVAAVAGTAVVVAGAPAFPSVANATTDTITVSPATAAGVNTSSGTTVQFTTNAEFIASSSTPPTKPAVTFTRDGATPTETITVPDADVTIDADPTKEKTQFTVKVNLLNRNPGKWNITVTGETPSPGSPGDLPTATATNSCTRCYDIVGYVPTASSVSPRIVGQGATATFLVKGSGFTDAVYCTSEAANCPNQPRLYITPGDDLTLSGTSPAAGGNTITKTLVVGPNAAVGARDVHVVNTDGKTAVCRGCLVVAPPPTLTPAQLGQGATSRPVAITGDVVVPGTTANVTKLATTGDVDTASSSYNATTRTVTMTLTVGSAAATGFRSLVLTDSNGGSQSFTDRFSVTAKPTVSGFAYPSNAGVNGYGQGAQSRVLQVNGSNFVQGATVAITSAANPATPVTVQGVQYVSPTQLDVTLSLGDANAANLSSAETKSVAVTNPDFGSSGATSGFLVNKGPSITKVTPAGRARNSTSTITIDGANFGTDVTVTIPGVTVGTATVTAGNQIVAPITIPAAATAGVRDVTVLKTTDKGQITCKNCFSVDNLHVESITPTITPNQAQTVTITGAGFDPDAEVTLSKVGVPDIRPTAVRVNQEGTSLEADLPLHEAVPGTYGVRVVNPTTNPGTGTCSCTITVVAPQATVDTVTSAGRPVASLGLGADDEKIEITGSGFTPGMTLDFDDKARIVVDHTKTVVTPAKITFLVDVIGTFGQTEDPALRMDKMRLMSATGAVVHERDFDVLKPPAITQPTAAGPILSRSQGSTGGTFALTVRDTATSGARVVISGDGVNVGTTTFTDGGAQSLDDTLTASNITVAANAPTGSRDVYVRNPDGGRAKCACTFVVSAPPTLTGINPAKGARGRTVSFTASGSGFQGGATVTVGSVVATGVIVTSPSALSGQVALPVGMATGTHDVVVTNPDNGKATKVGAFTVFTLPSAPTGVTAQRGNGSATVSWTPGADGGDAITGYTITSNPATTPVTAAGNATSVAFPGLTNGTSYTFTVVATNGAGNSPASAPSAPVVPATVPAAPTNVTATAGDASATVSWTASAANGGSPITGYKVTSSPGGKTATVGADATQAVVTDLTNDTAYTFTVVALNDVGESAPSDPSAAVTPKTVMLAPTNVVATRGDGTATVTWTPASANGGTPVTGYVVKSAPGDKTAEVGPGETTATVTGLTNGTAYTFTVTAVNAAGDRAESAPSNAVTPAGIPLAPATVTATAGHGGATVSWTAANANGSPVTSYTVTVSPGGDTKTVSGTSTSTTITGLTNGSLYTFSVKATNAIGTGPETTSNAVRPTWVTTLTASATSKVVSGGTSTVRGRLSRSDGRPIAGAPVQIYRRVSPTLTYSVAKTVTTAADGTWSATFTVTKNTRFRAFFAGATGYDEATSATRLTSAAYKVTGTYSISGRTVTVKGAVSPNAAGRTVYLRHRRSDGTVVNLATATVTSRGTYTLTRTLPRGTYNLYVYIGGSTTNVAGTTPIRVTRIS